MVVTFAGSRAPGRAGAAEDRVPEHGESRTARPPDLDQGLGCHGARRVRRAGPVGDTAVLPDRRGPGGPHAGTDRRPARRGPHRIRHAVRRAAACRPDRPGRTGQERIRERRRAPRGEHRSAAEPSTRHGRCAANRSGAEQPAVERGQTLPGVVADPGRGGFGRAPRRRHGHGSGKRRSTAPATAHVQQARGRGRWGRQPRRRPGPGDLQGTRGSPRRSHLRPKRRAGTGYPDHLHDPRGGGARQRHRVRSPRGGHPGKAAHRRRPTARTRAGR